MFAAYVIKSESSNKIYIGQTEDLVKRLKRHNGILVSRKTNYTKLNKGPWKLVYNEEFNTRKEAMKREKELKSSRGREFIKGVVLAR